LLSEIVTSFIGNPLFPGLAFFVGLGLGHWLALGRDKRSERNDAAQTLRESLIEQLHGLNPHSKIPNPVEIDALDQRLPWFKRKGFRFAFCRYIESRGKWMQDNKLGVPFYDGRY
jgi:hypothetical protein